MKIEDINEIKMYTKTVCPYCVKAKNLLKSKGLEWEEVNMEEPAIRESFMAEYPTVRTVPQIMINGNRIGGYDDLVALGLE
jgi:glutaredoxin 3|tara:strand:- start:852 stop:1094 length:243 start_codon:yes stop_codon:yes gene_type:complete